MTKKEETKRLKGFSIPVIFISLLIIVAAYLFYTNYIATSGTEFRDFAVANPETITKVVILDQHTKKEMVLQKDNQKWRIGQNITVRPEAANALLNAIKRIEVKSHVPKPRTNTIKHRLKQQAIKVMVYDNKALIKQFFVGDTLPNEKGTYIMMQDAARPYVGFIPGTSGNLLQFFNVDEKFWRTHTIIDYKPRDIKSVSVQYPQQPKKSFKIVVNDRNTYSLIALNDNSLKPHNKAAIQRYLSYFNGITYEHTADYLPKATRDSIKNSRPFKIITITTATDTNCIAAYPKYLKKNTKNTNGENKKIDFNKLYATVGKDSILVIATYYQLDPVTKELSYFIESDNQ